MEDPRQLDLSNDYLASVKELARDLAYGMTAGDWNISFFYGESETLPKKQFYTYAPYAESEPQNAKLIAYFAAKWKDRDVPKPDIFIVLGYLTAHEDKVGSYGLLTYYTLTDTSFRLLDKPPVAPTIFISYRRTESSALALLIEARLRLVGNAYTFIDKSLVVGEIWQDELKTRIKQSRYFLILLAANGLTSPHVRDEINLALSSECKIIPFLHGGFSWENPPTALEELKLFTALQQLNAIEVKGVSAEDFETALNKLLNRLGYPTY